MNRTTEVINSIENGIYKFELMSGNDSLAVLIGRQLVSNNLINLIDFQYIEKSKKEQYFQEIIPVYHKFCKEHNSIIIFHVREERKAGLWFLEQSELHLDYTRHIFVKKLQDVQFDTEGFELVNYTQVDESEYKNLVYQVHIGDPTKHLKALSIDDFYNQEKEVLGEDWNPNFMNLIKHKGNTIGILNLRIADTENDQL